uniref:Uncharacterized protein n=1 Tax=viral metagenome TaxID=1070528 RepID=A0A6M3L5P6_9ZZZZ
MTGLNDFEYEEYDDLYCYRPVRVQQFVTGSGVYLVIADKETGEVVRDDRPWQMKEGAS